MRAESGYGGRPDEPDVCDLVAFAAYWQLRQDALGIETNGEVLTRDEVVFVENMLALGHDLEWLPRDMRTRRPTNDFRWLSIRGSELTEKLTSQLARYNERNPAHPIARLWVMSRGQLAKIVLK